MSRAERLGEKNVYRGRILNLDIETVRLPNGGVCEIEIVRPDVYVKGGDYDMATVAEAQLARTWGARTVAIPFEFERSTSALLAKVRGGR